jgi:hypothetical protein
MAFRLDKLNVNRMKRSSAPNRSPTKRTLPRWTLHLLAALLDEHDGVACRSFSRA